MALRNSSAARCLALISGIAVLRPQAEDYWKAVCTRLVLELDERDERECLAIVTAVLAEQWGLLGEDPDRAKPLAEHPLPDDDQEHLHDLLAGLTTLVRQPVRPRGHEWTREHWQEELGAMLAQAYQLGRRRVS